MGHRSGVVPRVRLLVATVAAGGTMVVAFRAFDISAWGLRDGLAWIGLTAASALAEQFPIHVRYRTETLNLSLTEALWVGALMLARPSVLGLAMAAGVVLSQVLRRRPIQKVAFNGGQFVLAVTLAQAIYGLFPHRPPTSLGAWVATAIAMAGYAVVNVGLVSVVIALMKGRRLLEVLRRPIGVNVAHFAGNKAIGLAGAVIWWAVPVGLPLFAFPLCLAYVAYRTMAQSLQEGESVRTLIVEHASDGIFMISPAGTILSWNRAMERITGYGAAEAIGKDWTDELGVTAGVAGSGEDREEGALTFAPLTRRDGTQRWVHYSTSVIRTGQGAARGTVMLLHDATAEHEAERLKSDFVATISHELRTPLTPLGGFLQTLLMGTADDSEESRLEYYRIMLKQADRLETLIDQLLEVSRIEGGDPMIGERPVELTHVIAEQIHGFAEQEPARSITLNRADREIVVWADPTSLSLVLSNLVSNALKYSSPDAPVRIDLSVQDGQAVIGVHDAGEGIQGDDRDRVFERFFKGRSRQARGGVGLGLYISKRLVEAMDGRIWFESTYGAGSTFFVTLPLSGSGPGEAASVSPADPPDDLVDQDAEVVEALLGRAASA